MENLRYKCGNLPNQTVGNVNDIYWTSQNYVCMTKLPVIIHKLPNLNGNLPYCDVINGNECWISAPGFHLVSSNIAPSKSQMKFLG